MIKYVFPTSWVLLIDAYKIYQLLSLLVRWTIQLWESMTIILCDWPRKFTRWFNGSRGILVDIISFATYDMLFLLKYKVSFFNLVIFFLPLWAAHSAVENSPKNGGGDSVLVELDDKQRLLRGPMLKHRFLFHIQYQRLHSKILSLQPHAHLFN